MQKQKDEIQAAKQQVSKGNRAGGGGVCLCPIYILPQITDEAWERLTNGQSGNPGHHHKRGIPRNV